MNLSPYLLSIQVTIVATLLILIVGLGAAIVLARVRFPGETIVSTILNLPLVLPPSVVGFYLLMAFGRGSPIYEWFGIDILFTWQAAAIASAIVALPLMIESARSAIASIHPELEAVARTLGSSELEVLWRVTLPMAKPGILAGFILSVARAMGEFGATLMVAASIPGQTQTLPLAIYDAVQNQEYDRAHQMVAVMTLWTFFLLLWARRLEHSNRRSRYAVVRKHPKTTHELSA
ncbi:MULTISPECIES: molybdate ABC transporter permease subunit [Leptolyngbya]|uniref:molybdate ABC transporter permease subunit n=1 Tax=Leptolyngbya TaxID=47251 RepID=UPI00168A3E66|nr:molybdate ABC transporter permease subunit [Leptolyngbya sp. FACHB-1624]MBD1859126.1 molybdate ABC transporter permease subunit [Leptolyngbya sp. FACHB-1624]